MKLRLLTYACLAISLALFSTYGRGYWHPIYMKIAGQQTVSDIIARYGESSRAKLKPLLQQAGIHYPPQAITLLAMKDTNQLELWANDSNSWVKIKNYEINAASGKPGPKLREGDRQVPEGIYQIIGLNPNSAYHLSMKLNYPNRFDTKWAQAENRTEPGSNIFIHGKADSIGCLAMGDEAIEELFVLSHDVGLSNINVIIAPTDPRVKQLVPPDNSKLWVRELYADITQAFNPYQL